MAHDRRTFLRAAGGAALGLALGRPMFDGLRHADTPLALPPPSMGWEAAAEEAWQATWIVHEKFLYYLLEAGGADDPRDGRHFLPDDVDAFAAYVPPAPYELAQVVERQAWYRETRRGDSVWSSLPCTPSEVSELSTSEIRSRLISLGIDASPAALAALVRETVSPWSVAVRWLRGSRLPGPEEDLVALAAWELWLRTSHRPPDEILDDWAHQVLPECDRGDPVGACERGLRVWQELRPRWSDSVRTTRDADRCWAGSVPMANFVPALAGGLFEAGSRYREVGMTLVGDAIGQFVDDLELREELRQRLAS